MKSRWRGIANLGRSCGSKTFVPGLYGDDRAEPDQVILALKAFDDLDVAAKHCTLLGARLPTERFADGGRELEA